MMRKKFLRQRPLLTFSQFVIMLAIIFAIYVALDLNRRARAGQLVGVGEEALQQELILETTRQVELQATLDYVQSDDYVAAYARDEGGMLQPGEVEVVPLPLEATPPPPASPFVTPDPALDARPWQAWWRLLTDAPLPSP
ncbi:MAG: septum formation initiator family protein [Ardenticatenaceae bacterium]|nr:septum formation initiator family protein [Ardenticatenaceae bacterium]MCB9444184.1 septum formation initiator family protein [Ardenticatenaceae bacterium]